MHLQKKVIVITQSNYIPWIGYFDLIANADHLIIMDDVQYTKRDWRNRNKIKTPQGIKWLTLPISTKGKYASMRICDAEISNPYALSLHLTTIQQMYKKQPYYDEVNMMISKAFCECFGNNNLSQVNLHLLKNIMYYLGINTPISFSTDFYSLQELDRFNSTERLLYLCQSVEGTDYLSGPAAKSYIDIELFQEKGISLTWADYSKYNLHASISEGFNPPLSIIDTIMRYGKDTKRFLAKSSNS